MSYNCASVPIMQAHVDAFECDRCGAVAHTSYRVEKGETICEECFMRIVVKTEFLLDEAREKQMTTVQGLNTGKPGRVGDEGKKEEV